MIRTALIIATISLVGPTLGSKDVFTEYLAATCKDVGQTCTSNADCCSTACRVGVCTACIETGNDLLVCDANSLCCSECCLFEFCREAQSCVLKCLVDDSFCTNDSDCCNGCCSQKKCVSAGSLDVCTSDKVTYSAWFIILFYVLVPLFLIVFLVVLGIYCYRSH